MVLQIEESELCAVLARAEMHGREDFNAIERSLREIINGNKMPDGWLLPHRYALIALNCHGGLICAPLEMMKYHFPGAEEEPLLARVRELLVRAKRLAVRILELLKRKNGEQTLRHFSFKFRELFTSEWLASRQYTAEQLERVLTAASNCARKFLQWLAEMLRVFEREYVVDDMRTVLLGASAARFVLTCNRREGVILLRTADGDLKMFEISCHARMAWRIIRQLVESRDPDGRETLPAHALAHFRNTDGENTLKENGLSSFARYIHAEGEGGVYSLRPYTKRRNEH